MALLSRMVGWIGFSAGIALFPNRLCAGGANDLYAGNPAAQEALARSVDGWLERGFAGKEFATGSALFDSEWVFGTYQMAALGFGQMMSEHPESVAVNRPRMERAIDLMFSAAGRKFDAATWGQDPLSALSGNQGHVAFYGYANLAVGLHRQLFKDSKYAALNDSITLGLVRRYEHASGYLLETYPGQVFPVDNTAAMASIVLSARATGRPEPPIARRVLDRLRKHSVDPATGLLYQRSRADGRPLDAPRGSGTALAVYFLSFADADLSAELHQALERRLAGGALGFRAVREYPDTVKRGDGDIDSGPLLFGLSVSATGFAIAGCRIHHDPVCYSELLATADLFGAPRGRADGGESYIAGGPLGDAILFAMQTALPRRP